MATTATVCYNKWHQGFRVSSTIPYFLYKLKMRCRGKQVTAESARLKGKMPKNNAKANLSGRLAVEGPFRVRALVSFLLPCAISITVRASVSKEVCLSFKQKA